MASAKQATQTAQAPPQEEEFVNSVLDGEASVAPKRYFTIPGRDPFDEIEWETRDALIPGKDGPAFEQRTSSSRASGRRRRRTSSPQKYFRGRMASPERERSVKQMIGRVADTITGWASRWLLRERRRGRHVPRGAEGDPRQPVRVVQLPGLVQRRLRGDAAVLGRFTPSIDDSMESILDWIRREGIIFRGGSGSGLNLSRLRCPRSSCSRAATPRGRCRSCAAPTRPQGRSSRAARHDGPRRWSCSTSDHLDIDEFIWRKAREERKARVLEQAG